LTTAILSFLGVVMGASLQYVFTRYLDNQRHQRELRSQAYLHYLKSISGLAHQTNCRVHRSAISSQRRLTQKVGFAFTVRWK
jgi:membrane protein DedA with SNARE-associated domain